MQGLLASMGWGILMAAVITPGLGLTAGENLAGTVAGALIITAIFNVKG